MAEHLKTKRIGSELEDLISNAKKYVCIFTYSLIVDPLYVDRLKAASKRGVEINFFFGNLPKDTSILEEIHQIPNCKIYFKNYLHAKFYYNEESLIISSMNLSEISERNNYEIGILVRKIHAPEIFEKIKIEAREIKEGSIEWFPGLKIESKGHYIKSRNTQHQKAEMGTRRESAAYKSSSGTCIRCQKGITLNSERPLCKTCFIEWADWENDEYPEKYCHTYGKKKDGITFAKPECKPCYKTTLLPF